MVKKGILSLLMFTIFGMCLISFSAADLIVSCPSGNISLTAYTNYKMNCTFNNTYAFDVINLNVYNSTSIISMNNLANIPASSSVNSELNFYTNTSGFTIISPTFYFYYYVNSTLIPENKEVDIYNFEFRPSVLEITRGSAVSFVNKDNYNIHSVVDQGSEFSSGDIQINNSWSYVFNNIKNYTVRDGWVYGNYMTIRVKDPNELILTHNNDYDRSLSFNISSTYISTTLNGIILTSNFSSEWNESQEGVLSIQNNGSSIAKNIKLVGEWASFSKNNFDLAAGQTTYVNIEIIPYITTSAETNKTYVKTINISSNNTPLYSYNYNIFINYSANVTAITNSSDWVKYFFYKKEFCEKSNWTAPDCRTEPIIEYVPTYNCSDMQINITTTIAEWQRFLSTNTDIKISFEDFIKMEKEKNDNLNNSLVSLDNKTSQSLDLQKYNQDLNKSNMTLEFAIGFIIFVILVCGYLLYDGRKKQKQKEFNESYNINNEKYYKQDGQQ